MKTITFTFLGKKYFIGIVPQPTINKPKCNYGGWCKKEADSGNRFCKHHQQLFDYGF